MPGAEFYPRPGAGSNSLRIDIPKNDVPEENQRRDGVEYFDGDDDRFSDRRPADKLLNDIRQARQIVSLYLRPKRKIIPPEHVVKRRKSEMSKMQDLTLDLTSFGESSTAIASS